jgi:hypothetical protein
MTNEDRPKDEKSRQLIATEAQGIRVPNKMPRVVMLSQGVMEAKHLRFFVASLLRMT